MSSLRFTKAPPPPDGVSQEFWEMEWVGLHVGLASVFPRTVGCLRAQFKNAERIYDRDIGIFRHPVSDDAMNELTKSLDGWLWISRHSLLEACRWSVPPRPTILSWLDEKQQKYRDVFAVSEEIAEYLP